jgi:hypothetical protein
VCVFPAVKNGSSKRAAAHRFALACFSLPFSEVQLLQVSDCLFAFSLSTSCLVFQLHDSIEFVEQNKRKANTFGLYLTFTPTSKATQNCGHGVCTDVSGRRMWSTGLKGWTLRYLVAPPTEGIFTQR